MRITNSMLTRDSLAYVQASLRPLAQAQQQVSTGLRIQKASDDPAASSAVMRTSGSLRALEQYRRNIGTGAARNTAEESVLGDLGDVLTRAQELGVGQDSSMADAATNAATRAEVRQLISFVGGLANTKHGEEFLFGGDSSLTPPVADPANPMAGALPTGERLTEVSAGRFVQANHDAQAVFGTTGALSALGALDTALANNDRAAISSAVTALGDAFDNVQTLIGETGARSNQFEMTRSNLDALDTTLQTFRSDLQEIDLETAMTELVSRQTAYQAAMMATSKVLSLNLTDYLR